ncbi:Elongation factor P--(R)-beta-lysine ligase [Armadillidium nasatum]|uniref:Lysyl-tRNA synthetase n=1 Tax=Armadillidium nasatum TaxID=96803 RepID=A0A5N5THL2_9CRUS|nr:Elongation factor P--(R)-beta-lysine ligase [Armadillidium nasatum]
MKEMVKDISSIGLTPLKIKSRLARRFIPHKFCVTHQAADFISQYEYLEKGEAANVPVSLAGRVWSTRRMSKKLYFIDILSEWQKVQFFHENIGSGYNSCKLKTNIYLRDESSSSKTPDVPSLGAVHSIGFSILALSLPLCDMVMATFKNYGNQENFEEDLKSISRGDIIGVNGIPKRTPAGELSVLVSEIRVLTPCLRLMPSAWDKVKNQETKYRRRYLDLLFNEESRKTHLFRTKIIFFMRSFLNQLQFTEVETPILSPNVGGANAEPFATKHQDALNVSLPPFQELHLEESKSFLFDLCMKHNLQVTPSTTVAKLLDKLSSKFVESELINPTFIINHPVIMSPLAKEICNGYTELNDPAEQRRRFQEQARNIEQNNFEVPVCDENFCSALEYGLPPTGGLGIGIDRLTMILTNSKNMKDVILFPVLKPE